MFQTVRKLAALAALALAAACGTTATTPSPTFTTETKFFSTTLAKSATSSPYSFTLTTTSNVTLTLASITDVTSGEPLPATLTLNIGTLSGNTCAASSTKSTAQGLTAQITTSLSAGTYCVTVADAGSLSASANVTVRIVDTTGTLPTSVPGAVSLPSTLARGGSATKTFAVGQTGTIELKLSDVGGDTSLAIEIGLGVWDGAACRLNTTVTTTSGDTAQISMSGDAGDYCAFIKDVGNLTVQKSVSGTIVHP